MTRTEFLKELKESFPNSKFIEVTINEIKSHVAKENAKSLLVTYSSLYGYLAAFTELATSASDTEMQAKSIELFKGCGNICLELLYEILGVEFIRIPLTMICSLAIIRCKSSVDLHLKS